MITINSYLTGYPVFSFLVFYRQCYNWLKVSYIDCDLLGVVLGQAHKIILRINQGSVANI